MKWESVFPDEVLQGLIKEALTNNYDIRIAASRILQAQASLGVTRSNQLPALNGSFGVQNERSASCSWITHVRYGRLAAELHRRLLGTVPPSHRSRTRQSSGDRIRTPPGGDNA